MSHDAIVVGAGANELVAAHYLARAGRRVLVVSAAPAADDLDTGWVPPRIVADLELARHGFRRLEPDPWLVAALPDGGTLELRRDVSAAAAAVARLSRSDAAKWPVFCERMRRFALLLERLYAAPPPDPLTTAGSELARLLALGISARRLGRAGLEELLRTVPMSVGELLDDWFESDALKGALGAAGVMHLAQGPRSAGTSFLLLHNHVGSPAGVFRPPRSNLRTALRARPGVEFRDGQEVARILVTQGRVTGVALAGGEELHAPVVVSGLDPARTLLRLADPSLLEPSTVEALRHVRSRGVAARVSLTLDRRPPLHSLTVAPSLAYLERAWDEAKHGGVAANPWLEAAAVEQDGTWRLDVHVQCAPYAVNGAPWTTAQRDQLGARVLAILAERLPELPAAVKERTVLGPPDLERAYGWPEGQVHHAELALDQILFMRPIPECARYATPVLGLYLCGPGTHPGTGAGASGMLAARQVLKAL